MKYPDIIERLINLLAKLPGIGSKSAERIVFYILSQPDEYPETIAKYLIELKKKLKKCKICGNYSENEICQICSDPSRDKRKICIVEDPSDVYIIENLKIFNGVYHILFGVISPLDGISPDMLNINSLISRITPDIEEIIFALSPTAESETTEIYISKLLKDKNLKITKLAYGVPVGSNIKYTDSVTLTRSFLNREILKI